ncbi:MAG: Fe-S cluster assembly ATPase SufC [Flavobacteriales bacterium]|nr:Fe-S cluster assembly ATPase SufC [Flavobacteriales bacterium]|tara:strand:+ start:1505 stop:2245 length:741 start_codon:yes stop_codon:yes gene_type:complete
MLKINNLHCNVNDTKVLKGLSLSVNEGEVHAIMGPNGSGKSTLASVIAGNENYEVTNGSVRFFDKDILDEAAEVRARMGVFMSFQYPVEIPGVTVSNFIKIAVNETRKARDLKKLSSAELLKLMRHNLDLLKMDHHFLSRSMNDGFSGGEKKRNEIFQLSMLEPKLAILDETDSGLDIDALKIVSSGVNSLRSEKRSFIIITHYQRLLDYIKPDHVHILHNGKIIKSGNASLALELEKNGYDGIIK